jgi:PAS domain-containing protein
MVLLCRVPPPALVNSPAIAQLVLGSGTSETETDDCASSVTFEHSPRAALIGSVDETVEDINERAREMFSLARRQVIGQKLDVLVVKPPADMEELDELQIGGRVIFESLERMRKLGCDSFHWAGSVNCTRADDSVFGCFTEVEGVLDTSMSISGFVVFLAESAEEERMATQLREAREHVMKLMNQLIPSDVQGFIRDDRTDFAFLPKTVCVVAVQIATFAAQLRQVGTLPFLERVRTFWAKLGTFCAQHPPLVRQAELINTFIAIAGLFSADDPTVYAKVA